jgi:hypothetical protein
MEFISLHTYTLAEYLDRGLITPAAVSQVKSILPLVRYDVPMTELQLGAVTATAKHMIHGQIAELASHSTMRIMNLISLYPDRKVDPIDLEATMVLVDIILLFSSGPKSHKNPSFLPKALFTENKLLSNHNEMIDTCLLRPLADKDHPMVDFIYNHTPRVKASSSFNTYTVNDGIVNVRIHDDLTLQETNCSHDDGIWVVHFRDGRYSEPFKVQAIAARKLNYCMVTPCNRVLRNNTDPVLLVKVLSSVHDKDVIGKLLTSAFSNEGLVRSINDDFDF